MTRSTASAVPRSCSDILGPSCRALLINSAGLVRLTISPDICLVVVSDSISFLYKNIPTAISIKMMTICCMTTVILMRFSLRLCYCRT